LIGRALKDLNLRVVAELDDLAALDRRLKRLMKPARTLYRCYQLPLKQLSTWMAENNRYAERDLLANWKRIEHDRGSERRALLPDEVARAFVGRRPARRDAQAQGADPAPPDRAARHGPAQSARSSTGTWSDLKGGPDRLRRRRRATSAAATGRSTRRPLQELQAYVGERKDGPAVPRRGRRPLREGAVPRRVAPGLRPRDHRRACCPTRARRTGFLVSIGAAGRAG
jgi:hypothetical protein